MYVSKRNLFFKSKNNGYLLFCGNTNSFFQVDTENAIYVKKMFETNDDSFLPEEIKKEFIKFGVLLNESDENFFKRLKYISYQTRFNPYILYLTIAPTMTCNFKCTYCYEGDRIQNITMSENIIEGLIKFIKKGDYKFVDLTWYGGEPLCAWEKILEINKRIEKLKIPKVTQNIITNGSLIDYEHINFFIEKKFNMIQITLDGNEVIHNLRRPMKDGRNSYQQIINNLDKIYHFCKERNEKLDVHIRINIDKANIGIFKDLYLFLNERYNNFYTVYPGFVIKNSEYDCHAKDCLNSQESASFILDLAEKYNIFTPQLYPLRNKLTGCMIQNINTYVIGSNGDIYRCWDDISIPEKRIGNVITGIKDINNIIPLHVMECSGFEDELCKECLFLYSCMGGCPKNRIENKNLNPICLTIRESPEKFLETYYVLKNKKNYLTV